MRTALGIIVATFTLIIVMSFTITYYRGYENGWNDAVFVTHTKGEP